MKTFNCVFVLLAFVGLSLAGCSDQYQSPVDPIDRTSLRKVVITYYTLNLHYPVEVLDPGDVKLVGQNWVLKDIIIKERLEATNPLMTGFMIHNLNAVMNKNTGEGPVWGKFTATPDINVGGGIWEGNYTGYRSKTPGSDTLFTLPLKVHGKGKGGDIDGMKMYEDDVIIAWGTPPVGWFGGGEGYIKSY